MTKLCYFILIILCTSAGVNTISAQKYHTEVELSWWTDTTAHPELIPIVNLYSNYLNSSPDSVYDNRFWNKHEKLIYRDFDLSSNSLFQGGLTAKTIFGNFIPMLLKIEKKDNIYQLTTLLKARAHVGEQTQPYNPLAIMVYAVVLENGEWKMANILPYRTANWSKSQKDYITLYSSETKANNPLIVEKCVTFCDSICDYYDLKKPKPFSVYTVNGTHELGELLGYDYYIYGNAEGKSINNLIISGNGSAYYPHEFIHQLWPENDKRNQLLNEGIATWLGGSMNQTYLEVAQKFSSNALIKVDGNFEKAVDDHTLSLYAQGAILCEMVYKHSGTADLKLLLKKDTSDNDKLLKAILEITKWDLDTFNTNWKVYLSKISKG